MDKVAFHFSSSVVISDLFTTTYYLTLFAYGALDSRELSRYDFVYVVGRNCIDLGPFYDSYFRLMRSCLKMAIMIILNRAVR